MREFKFGLQLASSKSKAEIEKWAKKSTELGFNSLYLPDHFDEQLSPLITLFYAHSINPSVGVGTLVLDNDFRHPYVLAREIASFIELSGADFELGLGAGWMKYDYDVAGIKYDDPAIRVERFKEAFLIIKEFFSSPEINFNGEFYTIKSAKSFPQPKSKPKLLIGGGSKNVLSFAANNADIINVNASLKAGYIGKEVIEQMSPKKFDARIAWLKQANPNILNEKDIQCLTFVVQIGKNQDHVLTDLSNMFQVEKDELKDVPAVLVGEVNEVVETLQARKERFGYNYIVVHENEAESFSSVIEKLK